MTYKEALTCQNEKVREYMVGHACPSDIFGEGCDDPECPWIYNEAPRQEICEACWNRERGKAKC